MADAGLTKEAQAILVAAANDESGQILETETFDGFSLITNGQSFVNDSGGQTKALWKAVIQELTDAGFIGFKSGDVYEVTKDGYAAAKQLPFDPMN